MTQALKDSKLDDAAFAEKVLAQAAAPIGQVSGVDHVLTSGAQSAGRMK